MSPAWTDAYVSSLVERFAGILEGLDTRLDEIAEGRVAPALYDIPLGGGRKVRAAVFFFDIVGFSDRTLHPDVDVLKETLYMLDCVIPMVMHVVFDHGGYVEKNTGDGVMAIIGAGETDAVAANTALDTATKSLYVVRRIVNPVLESRGIEPISARITIDLGTLLIARIGTPKGRRSTIGTFLRW